MSSVFLTYSYLYLLIHLRSSFTFLPFLLIFFHFLPSNCLTCLIAVFPTSPHLYFTITFTNILLSPLMRHFCTSSSTFTTYPLSPSPFLYSSIFTCAHLSLLLTRLIFSTSLRSTSLTFTNLPPLPTFFVCAQFITLFSSLLINIHPRISPLFPLVLLHSIIPSLSPLPSFLCFSFLSSYFSPTLTYPPLPSAHLT